MIFESYAYITQVMVLAEIAIIFLVYKYKPAWAIYAILISIFLKGQYLWFGRPLYAWQIAALLGWVFLIAERPRDSLDRPGRALAYYRLSVMVYFTYTYLISILFWLIFSKEQFNNSNAEVSIFRVISQTFYLSFQIGIFGIGLWAGRFLTAGNLLRAAIFLATVVAYGAIIQWFLMRFIGINIFPIIGSDGTVRTAFMMESVFRASSFAGEPKHLGILMSAGLIYCYLARLMRIPIGKYFVFHKPLAMGAALLASLSSTGFALTAASFGVAVIIYFRRIRSLDVVVAGVAFAVLVTQVIGTGSDFATSLLAQLNRMEIEVQDASVVQGLLHQPALMLTGTGLGNIHLFAVDFLPVDFPLFRDDGYKANSGLWFIIGDSGLIGLFLLLIGPVMGVQSYLQMRSYLSMEQRKEAMTTLSILIFTALSFLLRFEVLLFLISGFSITRLTVLRTEALGKVHTSSHRRDMPHDSQEPMVL